MQLALPEVLHKRAVQWDEIASAAAAKGGHMPRQRHSSDEASGSPAPRQHLKELLDCKISQRNLDRRPCLLPLAYPPKPSGNGTSRDNSVSRDKSVSRDNIVPRGNGNSMARDSRHFRHGPFAANYVEIAAPC